jgi:hypothetical protein
MVRISRTLPLALTAIPLVLLWTCRATADDRVYLPVSSYYSAPPAVAYYAPPVVYGPGPQVSYYYAPPVWSRA